MTQTLFRTIISITGLFLFFTSCTQTGKETSDAPAEIKPVLMDIAGRQVPKDSMPFFKTVPAGKPRVIKAGEPTISPAHMNIIPAGVPEIIQAQSPKIIIPGKDGIELPVTTPVEFRKIQVINSNPIKALQPVNIEDADISLQYLDVEQGLTSSEILSVYQDKKGNIWIGTQGSGVIKFDGAYFTKFSTEEGFPNLVVKCILEDSNGNMFFGTSGGLVKYDGNDFTLIIDKGIIGEHEERMMILCMIADTEGNIWMGTFKSGLFKFDGKAFTNYSIKQGITDQIFSLLADTKGNIWIGGYRIGGGSKGVYKYIDNRFELLDYNDMFKALVFSIAEDDEGSIWFGTWIGASKLSNGLFHNYTQQQGLAFNKINVVQKDISGNMWFGTDGGGVSKYNGKTFTNYSVKNGFRNNQVNCIYQDRSGFLWFGTSGGGLIKQNVKGFTHFGINTALSKTVVHSIFEDNKGNIWYGTHDGTVIRYDGTYFYIYSQKEGFHGSEVMKIMQDRNGDMWFASLHSDMCKFDGKTFSYYGISQGISQNGFHSVYEDKKGNIWMGTIHKGVSLFNGKTFTNFSFNPEVWEGIWCFYEDKKGNMWFGTFDGRLIKYDGEIFTYFTQSFGSGIYQVNEDSNGNIWIAANGGLVKFDGKHFYQYNEILGMNNRNLTSMMQDKKGDTWIGTTNGLKYLEETSGEQNINPRVTEFSSHNGVIGELFQINAALLDSKGNAWWGTNRTVNKLDTKLISPDTTTPVMQLRFLNVGGRQIDFHHLKDSQSVPDFPANYKNIKYSQTSSFNNYPVNPVFPFRLNHLTFNFSAIDWSAPNQLKYSYMVEGLDDKWSELSSENTADYRNIPYGNYTFKVKAIGAAQKWSNIFEYRFTISPPWWNNWWFRSIAVLAILLVIYMYVRYRTKSLRERQKYLQQTVEKRTEQLRVSLAEKEVLLKEIHHRVKNNLEVISSLLRLQTKNVTDENAKAALIEGQNRVQSIALIHHKLYGSDDLANIEIKDFANGLFDHISKVFKKPEEKINFIASGNDTFVNTDIAVPVGLILNELFTNAFKYAIQAGRENILSLKINETLAGDKEIYQMIFSDNGAGMPESFILEKSKSLGMKVIHLLTKQLGGELKYYNKDGAVFEISFPKPNPDPSSFQKV